MSERTRGGLDGPAIEFVCRTDAACRRFEADWRGGQPVRELTERTATNGPATDDGSDDGRLAPTRRLRVSILDAKGLVAALAVCFRWPGLSVPVGLAFLHAFDALHGG
jgi:hypothetical protein